MWTEEEVAPIPLSKNKSSSCSRSPEAAALYMLSCVFFVSLWQILKKDVTVHQNAALLVRSNVRASNSPGYSSVSRSDLEGLPTRSVS